MGPVRSSTNSTSWGAYSPIAITAPENIQTQTITVQSSIRSLLVERVHIQVKRLARAYGAIPRSRDLCLRPLDPKSQAIVYALRGPAYDLWVRFEPKLHAEVRHLSPAVTRPAL